MKNKSLILDIETSLLEVYTFGIKDQFITPGQIKKDGDVMAWSAKWLDDPASKIMYMDRRNDKDDSRILKALWKILDETDILITQNGKAFDAKKLNARFIMMGMQPPKPYKHCDTYLMARGVAGFTSNKLEYLTDKLCTKYKKLSHSKFPGMSLWIECDKGNKAAWEEMKRYNIHDVLSTEELYNKLRPWAPKSTPKVYDVEQLELQCQTCGTKGNMEKRGTYKNLKSIVQRYKCKSCGAWTTGGIKK